MVAHKFHKGDIVKSKLNAVEMKVDRYINIPKTVLRKAHIRVKCVWIENGKECLGHFSEGALELIKRGA